MEPHSTLPWWLVATARSVTRGGRSGATYTVAHRPRRSSAVTLSDMCTGTRRRTCTASWTVVQTSSTYLHHQPFDAARFAAAIRHIGDVFLALVKRLQ